MNGIVSGAVSARSFNSFSIEVVSTRLRFVMGRRALETIRKRVPEAADGPIAGVAFGRIGWGTDSRTVVEIAGIETFGYGGESGLGNRRRARRVGRIFARARRSGLLPVGWVRSAGPGPASLSVEDLTVAERFFPETYHAYILLRREGPENVAGTVFVRDADGTLAAEPPTGRFEVGPAAADEAEFDSFEWPAGRRFRARGILLSCIGTACVLAGVAGYRLTRPPAQRVADRTAAAEPETANAGGAALTVELDGADIRATWNRGAPLFQGAKSAALIVRDGAAEKRIPLNLDLPGGVMLYTPKTEDVEVQVRTWGSGEHSEIVHVVAPERAGLARSAPAALVRAGAGNAAATRKSQPRRFVPPPMPRSAPEQPRSALPNAGAVAGAITPNIGVPGLAIPGGVSITAPAPPQPQKVEPAAENVAVTPAPEPPSSPVPTRKVFPKLPASYLPGQSTVVVMVSVNSRGVVNGAQVTGGTEPSRLLQSLVLAAAREWLFQPARVHGRAVDGQAEITFELSRPR
jgi:TonB family protein